MTALADDRDTPEKQAPWAFELSGPLATDSTQYYAGGIVCLSTATGKVVKGSTAATLVALGRCEKRYLTGTSTTYVPVIRCGIFKFGNSASADLIADDDIGKLSYIVDDQTVALTSNSGARSPCGTVVKVDSDGGVWVAINPLSGGVAAPVS